MSTPMDDTKLGLGQQITRRDFLNGTLLASGAALLGAGTPVQILGEASGDDWDGYGGVGDYQNSHGNPWQVMRTAHRIRDGEFDGPAALGASDTGEMFDLAIVGGGAAGLSSAYYFQKSKPGHKCLILENHPVFGGESKQNEFLVNGQRLMGPQGAWRMVLPNPLDGWLFDLYMDIGIDPRKFRYQSWDPKFKKLEFDRGADFQILDPPNIRSFGYFFDEKPHGVPPRWVSDLWENLDQSPFPPEVRRDLRECVFGNRKPRGKESLLGEDLYRWLDSITYQEYLEKYMGFHPEVTRFVAPLPACIIGLGPDAVSALWGSKPGLPGFLGIRPPRPQSAGYDAYQARIHAFPGGNTNTLRHLAKWLIPDSIEGQATLEDIHNRRIRFEKLDLPENSTRIRLNSTVIRVEHLGKPDSSDYVQVTYLKDGKLTRLRARAVVMASGTWVNGRVVRDLPADKVAAYQQILHSSMLVVNVAVTNWRFLYKLGLTGGRWFDGFGYFCNLRQQMLIGDYHPKLDPDFPNVLTFYAPFYVPGKPPREQVVLGRTKLLSTSFQDYERQIRETLAHVFGMSGFDPKKDIAGIILNRWGHSVIVPVPGLLYGRDSQPAPIEVAQRPFGRISFAHSGLEGGQSFGGAASFAKKAVQEALERLGG